MPSATIDTDLFIKNVLDHVELSAREELSAHSKKSVRIAEKRIRRVQRSGGEHLFLNKLGLTSNDLRHLIPLIPKSVRHLDLSNNKIDEIKDISFPRQLYTLNLGGNKIRELKGVTFPHFLQIFNIDTNEISSLKGIVFPDSLEELYAGDNKITDMEGVELPFELKYLDISENPIESVCESDLCCYNVSVSI